MEELTDVLKHIKNYADLESEEKKLVLESVYCKQIHSAHAKSIQDNQILWSDVDAREKEGRKESVDEVAEDGKEGAYRSEETRFKGKHRSIRDW
jgi:hypothetical protein